MTTKPTPFREGLKEYKGQRVVVEGVVSTMRVKKQGRREKVETCIERVKIEGRQVCDHMRLFKPHTLKKGEKLKAMGLIDYYTSSNGNTNLGLVQVL